MTDETKITGDGIETPEAEIGELTVEEIDGATLDGSGVPTVPTSAGTPSSRGNYRWQNVPAAIPQPLAPAIGLQLDDGLISQWEHRDELDALGIQPELAIDTAHVGDDGRMSWDQIDTLVNEYGWGIQNHSHAHDSYDELTPEEIKEDLLTAERLFAEHGYRPTAFVYPMADTGGDAGMSIVSQLYAHGYHDRDAPMGMSSSNNVMFEAKHPHLLNRVNGDERPLSEIEDAIDAATEEQVPIMLGGHDIIEGDADDEGTRELSLGKLEAISDYALDAGMEWGGFVDIVAQYPQWGIHLDPEADETYMRPHPKNGDWFFGTRSYYHFGGGALRLSDDDFRIGEENSGGPSIFVEDGDLKATDTDGTVYTLTE